MDFDARVIGVPDYLSLVKRELGKEELRFQNEKMQAAQRRLLDKLGTEWRHAIAHIFSGQGETAAHIYCQRSSFLAPLQEWATARDGTTPQLVLKENAWTEYLHLTLLGNNDGLLVPLDFATPLEARIEGRAYVFPVCSAPRLLKELELAGKTLRVEKAFRFPSVPDFMKATRAEMRRLEKEEDLDEAFWIKFGFVVIRHLAEKSQSSNLPVIFGERAVQPVG